MMTFKYVFARFYISLLHRGTFRRKLILSLAFHFALNIVKEIFQHFIVNNSVKRKHGEHQHFICTPFEVTWSLVCTWPSPVVHTDDRECGRRLFTDINILK